MAYRAYIRKDYKTDDLQVRIRRRRRWLPGLLMGGILFVAVWLIAEHTAEQYQRYLGQHNTGQPVPYIPTPAISIEPYIDIHDGPVPTDSEMAGLLAPVIAPAEADEIKTDTMTLVPPALPSQQVTVKRGDNLARIFSRLGLSPRALYDVMSSGKDVAQLKRLKPGWQLDFYIETGELQVLEVDIDLTHTLRVFRENNRFASVIVEQPLEPVVKNAGAIIKDSLFLSGKKAGLSDNLIMQMVAIYGWDIDFALDIREGDAFTLIYEEQYKDGEKVSEGPVIAAEFINRGKSIRALRYIHPDGRVDYYADNGDAMRKAFLRTPVNFTRISSRFNLKRKHPILNKIRAHKGVDYAAPTGTPVKATGDGTVVFAGRDGGYGKTIILQHGGNYSTVYAHLHRYARGMRKGTRVEQGQTIGYVGKSGLATGPHLHYEFRINGVHRNPLTVALPKVSSISQAALPKFRQAITPMLAELDRLTGRPVLTAQQDDVPGKATAPDIEDG